MLGQHAWKLLGQAGRGSKVCKFGNERFLHEHLVVGALLRAYIHHVPRDWICVQVHAAMSMVVGARHGFGTREALENECTNTLAHNDNRTYLRLHQADRTVYFGGRHLKSHLDVARARSLGPPRSVQPKALRVKGRV